MRITMFLLLFSVIQVMAKSSYSQSTRLSLDLKDVSIEQVLDEIENQSEFYFLYNQKLVNVGRDVDVKVRNKKISDILADLFEEEDVNYLVMNRQIVLSPKYIAEKVDGPRDRQAQEIVVTGTVSDENGEPLPGVTILLKGTSTGSVSDNEGKYTIHVGDTDAILVFSFVGYQTQEIPVGSQTVINIMLSLDITALDEIMVIGYGTIKKSDLTGSVSSVSSEEITQLPTVSVASALQGRASGVTVTENSGRPGSGATVVIRGMGTVGNSSPLYVVDGQILNDGTGLENINPNDIQSIEILKDASSSAIYGARAANGVVLITTKRGTEGKTRLSYNGYYGVQQKTDRQIFMTASEYVQHDIDLNIARGQVSLWEAEPGDPSQYGQGVNYWDKLWRTGMITDHNLSFSGGNSNSQFLVAYGYLKNEGVMIGQDYSRHSLRINSDHKIGKWLKVGESLQISHGNETAIGGTGAFNDVFTGAVRMVPTIDPERLEDGSWNGPSRPAEPFDFSTFSPNQYVEEWDDLRENWQALGNVYAEIQFTEGLKFRTTYSGLLSYNDHTSWRPQLTSFGGTTGDVTSLARNTNTTTNWQWDNLIFYDKSFGLHQISLLAGVTAQENNFEYLNASGGNFLDENVRVIDGSDSESRHVYGGKEEWNLYSYIGRLGYTFNNKYLFQANVRRDGSSRFGANNRWGVFPSFSAGWRLSEEEFMQNISVLSNLKLRGSWGKLGNDQIGLYSFAATVNLSQRYTFGETQIPEPGAAPLSLANEDIKWEETIQSNIGVDLGLFNNKLQFIFDYFIKNTNDMLLRIPVPASSGYTTSPFVNSGSVENKGWEFSGLYSDVTGDFRYNIALNLSAAKNEITSLGDKGVRIISGYNPGNVIADIGTEVFAFYGYVADGIYQNQAEIDAVNALNSERDYDPGAEPGAVRFKDIDGDGLITAEDRTVIGSPYPDFTVGLNLSVAYKGFDFTMFFQGVYGNDILLSMNDMYQAQPGGRAAFNLDRWFKEGDTNDPMLWGVGGLGNASGGRGGKVSSYHVFDGTYFRSKNMQIGYTLPETLTSKIGIAGLRVYISTKNLFTFWNEDKYNIINDPELGRDGAGFGKYNYSTTALPKTYVLGLNVDF